ncbi:MAG: hypothetical protein LBN96_06395, partial [Desulfovibrio sp.]|nr:hypothetical protein [Desulfovibrio sp.]
LVSCYPIHPEIFDRLYEDWATLERFQRTRGVLRLMAAVIHELWMGNDAGLMILPGSLPLDVPSVRDELTRHLSEGWNALVDHEVDGKRSVPTKKIRPTHATAKNWPPGGWPVPLCWAALPATGRRPCAAWKPRASAWAWCNPVRALPISMMR